MLHNILAKIILIIFIKKIYKWRNFSSILSYGEIKVSVSVSFILQIMVSFVYGHQGIEVNERVRLLVVQK